MPYRRLPNTDAARIRALKAALKKGQYLEIDTIAYPFALKQKIEFFLPKFEVAITNSKLAKEKQFDNSQKFSEYTKKARLYISHFIQVLNCPWRAETLSPYILWFGRKQFESSFSFDRTGFAAMGGKNNCRRAEPDQ